MKKVTITYADRNEYINAQKVDKEAKEKMKEQNKKNK